MTQSQTTRRRAKTCATWTWVGPLHADTREIMDFSTAVTETVPGDFRIKAVRFDAESKVGTIWRDWFWQGVPLPRPAEELLARS